MTATAWCGCPGTEHDQDRDHYQERVDLGECAWCEKQYDRTVSFEECEHATPTCAEHWDEYFQYVGWEFLLPLSMSDGSPAPMCPECAG